MKSTKKFKKIADDPNLVKDMHSKAIINTDKSGYRAALKRKKYLNEKNAEIEELKNQVEALTKMVQNLIDK